MGGGDFAGHGGEPGDFADFIAGQHGFHGHAGLGALVGGDVGIQSGDDFGGGGDFVLEIFGAFGQFAHDDDLGFQAFGGAEIGQQAVLQAGFPRLINNQLGFLEGHDEVAVFLHLALGGVPPFFPVVADDIGHEHVMDLVGGGFAAVAVEDELDQVEVMGGQVAHGFEVRGFLGEDVILGNGLELFGGKRQIHGVAGFAGEINGEAGEDGVHGFDAAEAPTAMNATAAFGELGQGVHVFSLNLPGGGQFFKFCSHKKFVFFPSRIHYT